MKIDKDINKAKTLDSTFYTDGNIFENLKNIFRESIQLVCLDSELEGVSNYPFVYFEGFLDEQLLLTNDGMEFKCMPNICTHRGHLLSSCPNNKEKLQCRYHGRTFGLDGKLKNAPGFEGALEFPNKKDDLIQIPMFKWNHFLFISLSENPNVFKKLNQINDIIPNFPYLELSGIPLKNEYIIECNWALYCDNYLEGFHIPYVHKGLNSDIESKEYEIQILNEIVLQKAKTKNLNDIIAYDQDGNTYAYYFFVFPNMMINYYKWGVSINIIEPISKNKTRIKYLIYNIKGENIPDSSSSSLDIVEREDQEVVLSVQKGIKSRYYNSGRFSPKHEKGVHYFHRLISEKILK